MQTPPAYLFVLLGLVPVGVLEWHRGSRRAMLCFGVGQLGAFAVAVVLLLLLQPLPWPWPWADEVASEVTAGPLAGMTACLGACLGLLSSPWVQRGWTALLGVAALALLFHGALLDLMNAVAVVAVLLTARSFRIGRLRRREQRQLAFAIGIALGAVPVLTALVPTDGPFGATPPLEDSWLTVLLNLVVVPTVTDALRKGRRWTWLLTVLWAGFVTLVVVLYITFAVVDPAELSLTSSERPSLTPRRRRRDESRSCWDG